MQCPDLPQLVPVVGLQSGGTFYHQLSVLDLTESFCPAVQQNLWRRQPEEIPPVFVAGETGRTGGVPGGGQRGQGLQHQHLPGLHPLERVVRLHRDLWRRSEDGPAGVCGGQDRGGRGPVRGLQSEDGGV